jgi:hypothetical protein
MDFKIHIICGATNLCKLIRKSLIKDPYIFSCTEVKDKQISDLKKEIDYVPDCIIVDKDIDFYFRDEIIKLFFGSKIILLPSLDDVELNANTKNVIQISEPFKLSELGKVLKEIYQTKQSEEPII